MSSEPWYVIDNKLGKKAMQTIGLVGVGRIGTEIAKHLINGGYRVLGYRRSSLAEFEKIGGTPARSPAHIAEQAEIVLSCLPGGVSLDDVVNGPAGLIHSARNGQIVAELGSHPLPAKERQVRRLLAKGAVFLDGEVSGTPGMVAQRKAPIYLAGDSDACKKIEPLIKVFADIYLYLGSFGAASKVKFVNNLLVTINTAAIGEAVSLALKAGVDPDLMIKAITNGSGGSVLFPIRAPRMVQKNYLPAQGTFEMLSHYFDYIDDLAEQAGAPTPLFDLAAELYRRGLQRGLGNHDVAAIIEVLDDSAIAKKATAT
jgi:3-hydroxyisobutyrate dehydrogenase-like beta-hydroxyacid dehydrogenase